MPERDRATLDGAIVTVLKGKPGRRGTVTIRDQFGYTKDVPGKELEPIPDSEPNAKLKYEDV